MKRRRKQFKKNWNWGRKDYGRSNTKAATQFLGNGFNLDDWGCDLLLHAGGASLPALRRCDGLLVSPLDRGRFRHGDKEAAALRQSIAERHITFF